VRRDREDAERADALAALLALTPDHLPLTTIHYSLATVRGFDYYNTKSGDLESGGADRIAVWMLDTDYDGRSLFPRQVFFPMAGATEGWARLARTESLPFQPGPHRQIAVKIVDDRGIESLRILGVD
jgi:adenine-specific DNA-methyltransferase